MSRFPALTDFSEFVRRTDRVKVYDVVNLLVGENVVKVNGLVISQNSTVLLELVKNQPDLILDDFVGDLNGVQDCVELLYGGLVQITINNIQTISKFSVMFRIECMYQLCLDWINQNISKENLFILINVGLVIENICHDRQDVLIVCFLFIKDKVHGSLVEISRDWNFSDNISFINFFIQNDILLFSLPILTAWVENDFHMRHILDQLEIKGMTEVMLRHGKESTELMNKMIDRVELLESSKKLLKLQSSHCSTSSSSSSSSADKNVQNIIYQNYSSFLLDKILNVEEAYKLEHFEFVEVLVHWITCNKPTQSDVIKLWDRVRQGELCFSYVCVVGNTIENSRGTKSYSIPDVVNLGKTEYQYCDNVWDITTLCNKRNKLTDAQIDLLLNKSTVILNMKCKECNALCNIKLKLDNKSPCYELEVDESHCLVKHWYIGYWSELDGVLYSLLTNEYSSVIEKIKRCRSDDRSILYLCCLYQCAQK